jgi:hypothetical protein
MEDASRYVVKFRWNSGKNTDVNNMSLSINVTATSKQEAEARAYGQVINYGSLSKWNLVQVEEDV